MNLDFTLQPGSIISYQLPGTLKIWAGRVLLYVNGKIKVSILNAGYEELTEWIDVSFVIGVVHASSADTTKHSS